jgi:trimethylamine-N-oxide reductase cytochrome c-type subunit TorC
MLRSADPRALIVVAAAGLAAGVIFWGAFNTAIEASNSLSFCISCHEMRNTVYEEYKTTVHYKNASGVRAICSDCHVPKDWTHKVVRKIEATKELYHKLAGSIDTREKFEAKRLDLARHEWNRMRASDSRECRNCHSLEAMDFHKQSPKAAAAMSQPMKASTTCIDCHKGIAHKMPDLTARHRAMHGALLAEAQALRAEPGARLFSVGSVPFHLAPPTTEATAPDGEIAAAVAVRVLAVEAGQLRLELVGWQREGSEEMLYALQGKRILAARLEEKAIEAAAPIRSVTDPDTDDRWTEMRLTVFAPAGRFVAGRERLWAYGAEMYDATCSFCHALHAPARYAANDWIGHMNAMRRFVALDAEQTRLLQTYLQLHAKDAGGAAK